MKHMQSMVLEYFDQKVDEDYDKLIIISNCLKIIEKKHEIKLFFHFILVISNNHYRNIRFFDKVDKIILLFKADLQNLFSSDEIYFLFRSNKRILLFLIKEKVLTINKSIYEDMNLPVNSKYKFIQYFKPEMKEFVKETNNISYVDEEIDDDLFEEKRLIGENDDILSKIIRNDNLNDFIEYVNHNNISLLSTINSSIYETNSLLQSHLPTLIEYSAFFGSIRIFKYLYLNGCKLNQSIWKFAIHGNNPELIHLLEENQVEFDLKSNIKISIQCHHNEIADYFICNSNYDLLNDNEIIRSSIKFYNYSFLPQNYVNNIIFYDFCKYNYVDFVRLLLNDGSIKVNSLIISNLCIF